MRIQKTKPGQPPVNFLVRLREGDLSDRRKTIGRTEISSLFTAWLSSGSTHDRKIEHKSRSTQGRIVIGSNASIVRFNDRLSDRQAQTHAALLGRKEAVKQMRQMLRVDARAANPAQDEIIPRRRQNVAADRRRPARM